MVFWRVSTAPSLTIQHPEVLQAHLSGLLTRTPLVTVLVQRRDQQRLYLRLPGCTRCGLSVAHSAGCISGVVERVLRATLPGSGLVRVDAGLVAQPLRQVVVAIPTAQAQPLDGCLLHPWPEARLLVWCQRTLRHPTALALLAVSSTSPQPTSALHTRGWRVLPLHWLPGGAHLLQLITRAALPLPRAPFPLLVCPAVQPFVPLPRAPAADSAPTTLSPAGAQEQPTAEHKQAAAAVAQALCAGGADPAYLPMMPTLPLPLREAAPTPAAPPPAPEASLDTPPLVEDPPAPVTAQPRFPTGPAGWPPEQVQQAVEHYCLQMQQKGELSKKDVTRPLRTFSREPAVAEALLAWLDASGLFAPPVSAVGDPWQRPRTLTTLDRTIWAARLHQTSVPACTGDTV